MGLYLVSGGFTPFAKHIAEALNFSGVHANHLDDDGESLLGTVSGTVVDGLEKRNFLAETMVTLQLDPEDAIAVGDGANDLQMMAAAGLAVGYQPKDLLIEHIDGAIFGSHLSLIDIIEEAD